MEFRLLNAIKNLIDSLLGMIFPNVCEICGNSLVEGEKVICSHCTIELPRTGYHLDSNFNELHKRLLCHCPIERATAFFHYYKDNRFSHLIHLIKYGNRPELGVALGQIFTRELKQSNFFNDIDLIIPVPIHSSKKRKRGYNQSEMIARGISKETGIPVSNNLVAYQAHSTQTRKNAIGRWLNSEGIFGAIGEEGLDGRHVLIVDDVITTGATMIRCCEAIHSASPTTTVSVLSLASTKLA